eukprot:768478-Hanusia_phi.AAC.18
MLVFVLRAGAYAWPSGRWGGDGEGVVRMREGEESGHGEERSGEERSGEKRTKERRGEERRGEERRGGDEEGRREERRGEERRGEEENGRVGHDLLVCRLLLVPCSRLRSEISCFLFSSPFSSHCRRNLRLAMAGQVANEEGEGAQGMRTKRRGCRRISGKRTGRTRSRTRKEEDYVMRSRRRGVLDIAGHIKHDKLVLLA